MDKTYPLIQLASLETLNVSDRLMHYFSKRMNLLIVDDDEIILSYLEGFEPPPLSMLYANPMLMMLLKPSLR